MFLHVLNTDNPIMAYFGVKKTGERELIFRKKNNNSEFPKLKSYIYAKKTVIFSEIKVVN